MHKMFGSFTVAALAWGLAGCDSQAPKSAATPASPAPAKSPAPTKSAIPAAKLAQIVLEVPGMT